MGTGKVSGSVNRKAVGWMVYPSAASMSETTKTMWGEADKDDIEPGNNHRSDINHDEARSEGGRLVAAIRDGHIRGASGKGWNRCSEIGSDKTLTPVPSAAPKRTLAGSLNPPPVAERRPAVARCGQGKTERMEGAS